MNVDFNEDLDFDAHLQVVLQTQRMLFSNGFNQRMTVINSTNLLFSFLRRREDEEPPVHGGSRPGRMPNLPRDFEAGYNRLFCDYFSENPVYPDHIFRRRFRMRRLLFLRITEDVQEHNDYFLQKADTLGKPGLQPLQKITSAVRMLAYGGASDLNDEYLRLGESTSNESLIKFCRAVIDIYGAEYTREPNTEDLTRLLAIGEKRGFPGMLGSLDCMHWEWKNCPSGWAGQFQGKEKVNQIKSLLVLPIF
jgi:hypothetical protein